MGIYTLNKKERLKSRKLIDALMAEGSRVHTPPVKAVWLMIKASNSPSVQVAFSVPKRSFKKAVDRNRIKRLMREGYRLNKIPLLDYCNKNELNCSLMLIYSGNELPEFKDLQSKIIITLQRLVEKDPK